MESREELVKRAIALGFREDQVERAPVYVIAAMLAEREHKQVEPTVPKDAVHKLEQQQQVEVEDDNKTVVNMDFVTSTANPAEQKYKRFGWLVAAKNDLTESIKRNTHQLEVCRQQLDVDDVLVIQKAIKDAQYQFSLVEQEMHEIHQWFCEVNQQKQAFYQEFLRQSSDLTGDITAHFQLKLNGIQKYMHDTQKYMSRAK